MKFIIISIVALIVFGLYRLVVSFKEMCDLLDYIKENGIE